MLTLEDVIEILPDWKKQFVHFPAFRILVDSVNEWLDNPCDKTENHQAFCNAFDNFHHLCETDPEGIKALKEEEKKIKDQERDKMAKNLYRLHIENIQMPLEGL